MQRQIGDTITYKSHYTEYAIKNGAFTKPNHGIETKTVRIVASTKDTDYQSSDWIVCNPKDYPPKEVLYPPYKDHSYGGKCWGISEGQIIN